MSIPDRSDELIQKYIEGLASKTELAELEGRLATDPEFAVAFADAARLEVSLHSFFQKQYKIDQVAALLNAPEPAPSPTDEQLAGRSGNASQSSMPTESSLPKGSLFIPRYRFPGLSRVGRTRNGRRPKAVAKRWKWIAAAVLLLATGMAFWTSRSAGDGRLRLISGRLTVAGRAMADLRENVLFEVVGSERALIELPGGARVELTPATRALIRRDPKQFVVRLDSGGGEFRVLPHQSGIRVETVLGVVTTAETVLGVVTTAEGQFTLDVVTTPSEQFSTTEVIPLPRLVVAVALGSVILEQAGTVTTLSAGEERVFFNAI